MAALEQELIACVNNEDALSIIIRHLLSTNATFHHHSFNSYLIDELKKSIKHIDWDCFTPSAIKTYNGPVYRGTSQPPEKIFNQGFQELSSSNSIEDYLKFKNNSIGISTTRDFDCALEYATNNKRSSSQRYIYVINYSDNYGYDILETGKARGLSFNPFFHKERYSGWSKREINIKNSISYTDIIGAWKILKDGNLSWIDNPHYKSEEIQLRHAR